jgi:hypothetical protein
MVFGLRCNIITTLLSYGIFKCENLLTNAKHVVVFSFDIYMFEGYYIIVRRAPQRQIVTSELIRLLLR